MSAAVAPRFQATARLGHVHSIFSSALNITTDDGYLLTIADPRSGLLPNGVLLAHRLDFATYDLAPGDPVAVQGDHILIGDALEIAVSHAESWSPWLAGTGRWLPRDVASPLRAALDRTAIDGGFAPLLRRVARGTFDAHAEPWPFPAAQGHPAICRLIRMDSLDEMLAAARFLIGLGHGLTPSGDDLLVGFAAALWAAEHPLAESFGRSCEDLARGRTTDVAAMFYHHAARGEFSARIHDIVGALADSDDAALQEVFTDVLGWGATSGADCLLGLLLGHAATARPSMAGAA